MKLVSMFVIFGLIFPLAGFAFAFSNPLGGAFGGRTTSVTYCTCSFSLMLNVGPHKGGTFIYIPFVSTVYKYYQVFSSGSWVLGTSSGTSTCLVYSGNSCVSRGTGSIIRKIGTSLY